MRLLAMTCGWLTGPLGNFLDGEQGSIRVPVPSFLIDHPQGLVLFDSGMHPGCRVDPAQRLGGIARIFTVDYGADDDVGTRLAQCDVRADRVRYLVNSHLHFDHAGGNALIPNAQLVIQRREWEAGHDAELRQRNFFDPRDYDLGHDVLCLDGAHDLFRDGRVVCIPTPGHTPGHQSLRVRLDSGDVILTGDACYLRRTLDDLHLPGVVHDRELMLTSLHALRRLRAAGARIIFGHDPELWSTVPQAPITFA
jgi:glyoxylase-like metal-dependent hydrolase (beta-lactamase superfamily II)